MALKCCKVCGREFEARGATNTCSPEHRKISKRETDRRYRASAGAQAKQKTRWASPEYREKKRAGDRASRTRNRDLNLLRQKVYRDANRERLNALSKARHAANPEIKRAQARRYASTNKEKRRIQNAAWYEANRVHIKNYAKQYRAANREANRRRQREYRIAARDKIRVRQNSYREKNRERLHEKHRLWLASPKGIEHAERRRAKRAALMLQVRALIELGVITTEGDHHDPR